MTITRAFTSILSLLKNNKTGRLYSRKLSTKPCLSNSGSLIHSKYSVGDVVHGFKVSQITDVPELQLTAVRLSHEVTGADYLHLAKDDPNNVFSVGFRTTPMDSTGVPHILEHTVLCGSKKYPVRDPFFKMLNRSLSTFMNAMTGNDFTVYPFCTQNKTDYKNLMSVYLDAVFNPNLNELDFSQEGWRLEHSDLKNRDSDLEFKGVVFNEMKGVFANYQNLFLQKLQNGVLPSHTYGVVSGGYPLDIPNLTWDALRDFHKHHYHPSNSKIYSYGNQELSEILEYIENNYLKFFTKIEPNTEVPEEPIWSKPQFDHIECGVDPLTPREAQNSVAMSYLLCDISDSYEVFVLQILSELLVSGPNAPFYKSLIEKQYGTSYIPGVGYSGDTRSTTFSIGLVGVEEKKTDDILGAIEATFNSVKKNGFPMERVEAILHSIELGLKHQSANFGLGVYMSMCSMWNLDCDPIKALQINDIINRFKNDLKENPTLFQEKIDEYFLKNKHKYTLTMAPKENYEESIKEKEVELLKKRVSSLSNDEKEKIYNLGITLAEQQNAKENLDCLPTLHVADIERKIQYTTLDQKKLLNIPVQVCVQPTNDVLYFQSILNIQNIPSELESYVPLLCVILTKMGASDLSFREFDQKVESTTGGLGVSMLIEPNAENSSVERGIVLSSHCLPKNSQEMFKLWEKVINELNLNDMDRFSTLVKMVSSNAANGVTHSGHRYAMLSAGASVNGYGAIREKWSGLTYIQLLNQIAEMDDLSPVLEKLSQLATLLINKERMRVAINVTSEYSDSSQADLNSFLSNIRGEYKDHTFHQDMESSLSTGSSSTHHIFPFPVNYTSVSFPGVAYNHPDAGSLRVLGRLLFPYLHREIREKGGAYGGGASASPGGPFTFYSYRDPNNTASLNAFDGAIDWVLGEGFSEREVEEAKLGVMQSLDAPVSPGSRGLRFFRSRITDPMFEHHRQSVLECSREQIISAAREHVKDASKKGACLIGPPCPEIDEREDWRTVNHG